jgi:hypothetical protein
VAAVQIVVQEEMAASVEAAAVEAKIVALLQVAAEQL